MPLPKEQHKYTVDDILALPDGQRAELIDGQIYDMGTPTKTHQDILGYLFFSVVHQSDCHGTTDGIPPHL